MFSFQVSTITNSNLSDDNFCNSMIYLIKISLEEYEEKFLFESSLILNDSLISLNDADAIKIMKDIRSNKDEIDQGVHYPTNSSMRTKFIKDSNSADVVHLFDLNRTELIRKIEGSMLKKKFEESMNLCFSDNVEEPSSLS